jgi:S-(hydroxymethyl)glutathione synthase
MAEIAKIHPAIDAGIDEGNASFLYARAKINQSKLELTDGFLTITSADAQSAGSRRARHFQLPQLLPTSIAVIENGGKLQVVDDSALIRRHACKECGVIYPDPSSGTIHSRVWISFILSAFRRRVGQSPASPHSCPRS